MDLLLALVTVVVALLGGRPHLEAEGRPCYEDEYRVEIQRWDPEGSNTWIAERALCVGPFPDEEVNRG